MAFCPVFDIVVVAALVSNSIILIERASLNGVWPAQVEGRVYMAHQLLAQGLEALVDLGAKCLGGDSFWVKFPLSRVIVRVFMDKFSNEVLRFASSASNYST
jgi:hypothetical protein